MRRSEGPAASSPAPASSLTNAVTTHLAPARSPAHPRQHHNTISTFPPSPAVVTDAIENQTRKLSVGVTHLVGRTNGEQFLLDLREQLSSVIGVEGTIFALEAFCLQQAIMPWIHAFDIPPIQAIGTDSQAVFLPNMFVLLSGVYWRALTLWLTAGFLIPLAASWFYNLTIRPTVKHGVTVTKPRWRCDPLMYNVVKALMAWIVYSQRATLFGMASRETSHLVLKAMPGGYSGIMISSFIGMLVSLYDAVQKR